MTRENAEAKGQRYLTEGRVVIEAAGPGYLSATVRGAGDIHVVSFARGGWACSCSARGLCSHLHAVRQVAAPTAGRLLGMARSS